MMNLVKTEQSQIKKRFEINKEFEEYVKEKRINGAVVGSLIGLCDSLFMPMITSMKFDSVEEKTSIIRVVAETTVGGLLGLGTVEIKSKLGLSKKRIKLSARTEIANSKATSNLLALKTSKNNMFMSYVDGHVVEENLYNTRFTLEGLFTPIENLESSIKSDSSELKTLSEQIEKREKEMLEAAENTPSDDGIMAGYKGGASGETQSKSKLADARKRHSELQEKIEFENKELQALKEQLASLEQEQKEIINRKLPFTLANRAARDYFDVVFVEPLEEIIKELTVIEDFNLTGYEIDYASQKLDSIEVMTAYIEKLWAEYLEEISIIEKNKHSTVGKIKSRGATDMTYANAPFWRAYHTYANPAAIKDSNAYVHYWDEIIEGAIADHRNENAQGTWLLNKNFNDEWLFEIGEFSDAEAERLYECLSDYMENPINHDTAFAEIHDAYRKFAKVEHSDLTGREEDRESFQEVSTLVKKFKKYAETRDSLKA